MNNLETNGNIVISDVTVLFRNILNEQPDLSIPVAVIKALDLAMNAFNSTTMTEFIRDLTKTTYALRQQTNETVSVAAGCELFTQFVGRMASEDLTFQQFKEQLSERVSAFVDKSHLYREKIARVGLQFIRDGSNILIHSCSKVVMLLLLKAAEANYRFTVYVTEARPACQGKRACELLRAAGIPSHLILDCAVGYYIQKMDMILVGAEGVVENGGLINQVGTFQISILAKEANKPFYALAESYKFVRLFPLNQYDLPSVLSSSSELLSSAEKQGFITPTATMSNSKNNNDYRNEWMDIDHPLVDYTPPSGITLLFTDLGVLTPSGVSDELIKFYY